MLTGFVSFMTDFVVIGFRICLPVFVVAVRWVRPVFKYGVAVCFAAALGLFLYVIFYGLIPQSAWSLLLFMLLSGALGYFIAEMLLRKSFRVFRGSWRGCLVLLACLTAAVCAMDFDLIGFERRVPDPLQVESVIIQDVISYPFDDINFHSSWEITDPEQIALVTRLHQAVVDNRLTESDYHYDSWHSDGLEIQTAGTSGIQITYRFKGEGVMRRSYSLSITEAGLADPDSPAALLNSLINSPGLAEQGYLGNLPEGCRLTDAVITSVYFPEDGAYTELSLDPGRLEDLLAAVRSDLAAGRLGVRYLLENEARLENCCLSDLWLTFSAPVKSGSAAVSAEPKPESANVYSVCISLQTSAADTLEVLRQGTDNFGSGRLLTHAESSRMTVEYTEPVYSLEA